MLTLKKIPVSVFITLTIVLIFGLYATTALKQIPCGKDITNVLYGNFVHIDIYHLLSNIFALYALSRVEISIGWKSFLALICFLLFFNTLAETAMYRIFKTLKCSIGFSGVLFGIATWELVNNKGFDWFIGLSVLTMIAGPSINNPKASLIGHSIGAISGIIGGLLWSKIGPKNR